MQFKLIKVIILSIFSFFPDSYLSPQNKIDAREQSIQEYLNFLEEHDLLSLCGDCKKNEIEIIVDKKKIREIENAQIKRLISQGFSPKDAKESSTIGIVSKDKYWIWLRDAVIFPSKEFGTYDRIVCWSSMKGPASVAVLPIMPDGKIVLNLIYRHATRSWELELPRGRRDFEESIEQTAIRELQEETGLQIDSCVLLGEMTSDSSYVSSIVPIFAGKVCVRGKPNKDYSEAILSNVSFTKEEIKKACKNGKIEFDLNSKKWKIPIRDSFLIYALYHAELKGLL